jgi:hypothetical protein
MSNLTHLPWHEYKGKSYVKNIGEKKCIGSETGSGYGAKQPNTLTRHDCKGKIDVMN